MQSCPTAGFFAADVCGSTISPETAEWNVPWSRPKGSPAARWGSLTSPLRAPKRRKRSVRRARPKGQAKTFPAFAKGLASISARPAQSLFKTLPGTLARPSPGSVDVTSSRSDCETSQDTSRERVDLEPFGNTPRSHDRQAPRNKLKGPGGRKIAMRPHIQTQAFTHPSNRRRRHLPSRRSAAEQGTATPPAPGHNVVTCDSEVSGIACVRETKVRNPPDGRKARPVSTSCRCRPCRVERRAIGEHAPRPGRGIVSPSPPSETWAPSPKVAKQAPFPAQRLGDDLSMPDFVLKRYGALRYARDQDDPACPPSPGGLTTSRPSRQRGVAEVIARVRRPHNKWRPPGPRPRPNAPAQGRGAHSAFPRRRNDLAQAALTGGAHPRRRHAGRARQRMHGPLRSALRNAAARSAASSPRSASPLSACRLVRKHRSPPNAQRCAVS